MVRSRQERVAPNVAGRGFVLKVVPPMGTIPTRSFAPEHVPSCTYFLEHAPSATATGPFADFQWNPEGCFNRDATPSGTGFVDVLKFGQYQPVLDSNILDVASYVQHKVNGQPITGISPVDVVNNLTLMVTGATTVANDLQQGIGAAIVPELNETLTDLLAVSSLGSYYADKLCGATELAMYVPQTDVRLWGRVARLAC